MLLAYALFCNGKANFVESVRAGDQQEIQEFKMETSEVQSLKRYFSLLFFHEEVGTLSEGWVRQLHRSAGGGDKFLFNAHLFGFSTFKDLMNINWNECIYRNEGVGKDNKYKKSGLISKSLFDPFKKKFLEKRDSTGDWKNFTNQIERFNKLMFDTLGSLYNFNA